MRKYIGIDLGTSGVKILLVEANGMILAEVTENYPTFNPYDNWSEQNPEDWWQAVKKGLKKIICNIKKDDIEGISFSGQMHGLVILDEENKIIRPCILWNDNGKTRRSRWFSIRCSTFNIRYIKTSITNIKNSTRNKTSFSIFYNGSAKLRLW